MCITEERFLLLLRPPSLILSGATFLGLGFGRGLAADLDFLRALGPEKNRDSSLINTTIKLVRNILKEQIFMTQSKIFMFCIYPTLPFPSLVLALRSGGAGAGGGAAGVGAAAGAGAVAGEAEAPVSAPPSVPATTMFSTAAATLAAARAALAVAQPYKGTQHKHTRTANLNDSLTISQTSNLVCIYNTFRGLLVLNSLHFAIISVIILDTAILGFLAAINGLRTEYLQEI